MQTSRKARVVALLGHDIQHRGTLATLVESGVDVVGVCFSDERTGGLPIRYIRRSIFKRGTFKVLSQIVARMVYKLRNRKRDAKLKAEIFERHRIESVLSDASFEEMHCIGFGAPEVLDFVAGLSPDILVVHTGSWVPKTMREIESVKYVVGGHPGLTPHYRGAHSPFWAIYNGHPEEIGWTAFLVDSGVDTGPVVAQGRIRPEPGDTYMALSWRGMTCIAKAQAEAIRVFEETGRIQSVPHGRIPANSEYLVPTLGEQLAFWFRGSGVR
ncbi:hypothetical protein GCM10011360_21410 [Primorskyibacter flagellatus]|uniref:Formyl transferase N-terminal domain-containing protein n=1 Tax=Primorskyibacter flagellatus TaxID=1387277 RepID=A0A917A7K0_9RHOB|nr:formyltransferase family protein [Primorskyibacter flagellatus]GGE33282.1 hypothetical protein GCM10011360_21410 [Primorskyibacter flagellatus]